MEAWAWLLAYVLGFGLLQLFLYRYFQDERRTGEGAPSGLADGGTAAAGEAGSMPDGDGIHCEHCGTYNEREPNYRFCRECASPLR